MANTNTPVALLATSTHGSCSHCGKRVAADKYGYALGHEVYNPRLRVRETCEGTQELTGVSRVHPRTLGLCGLTR